MSDSYKILTINPGSTSTKLALYENENCVFETTIRHSAEELAPFKRVADQFEFRRQTILKEIEKRGIDLKTLSAVVGRGGLLRPIPGGTYRINDVMLDEMRKGGQSEHASNLGSLIAHGIAAPLNIPSFIVDPVSVDELEEVARISGIPELPRRSLSHALNMKAVAHRVANDLGKKYQDVNLIIAHLGGGLSLSVHREGRMVDVESANEGGPFSPERAGRLPADQLAKLCFSGKYTYEEMKKYAIGKGGLVAHLRTNDAREVEAMINNGNKQAELLYKAMAYQIAKEIGAMAAVLKGKIDAIVLTGGIAYSKMLTGWVREYVEFLAPFKVYPGEDELKALAEGALRVLRGEEEAKVYA